MAISRFAQHLVKKQKDSSTSLKMHNIANTWWWPASMSDGGDGQQIRVERGRVTDEKEINSEISLKASN